MARMASELPRGARVELTGDVAPTVIDGRLVLIEAGTDVIVTVDVEATHRIHHALQHSLSGVSEVASRNGRWTRDL